MEAKCERPVRCGTCGGDGIVGRDGEACTCARYGPKSGYENCGECDACRRNAKERKAKAQ